MSSQKVEQVAQKLLDALREIYPEPMEIHEKAEILTALAILYVSVYRLCNPAASKEAFLGITLKTFEYIFDHDKKGS